MIQENSKRPSLENFIENEDMGIEILHPGGLEITRELAELCHVRDGTEVLDVASGTGESTCYLAEHYGCRIVGVDASTYMLDRAREKAEERNLNVEFQEGDAHQLPFEDNRFDVVFSECTTCLLDKERAIQEMMRVAKLGGYVGIHDICWKEDPPVYLKEKLADIEGERPETLEGWKSLFTKVGLTEVMAVDRSSLIPAWTRATRAELGLIGQLKIFLKVLIRWGIKGISDILASEKIFQSEHTGYGIIVGRKH